MTIKLNSVGVAAVLEREVQRRGGAEAPMRSPSTNAFMDRCLAGKIPLTAEESPRARSLGGAFASASVPKHTSRRRAATRSRTELGKQH